MVSFAKQKLVSTIRSFFFIFIVLRDSLSFLKEGFTGYNSWLSFFCSTLSMSFHSLLATIISADFIEIILGMMSHFFLAIFKIFSVFQHFHYDVPGCNSFKFIYL